MDDLDGQPDVGWRVLLLGGPSGVGKTTVAHRLARHLSAGVAEVDDFQALLEGMTTAEQFPAIHFWRTHPAADRLPADEIVRRLFAQSEALQPGLDAVIANRLTGAAPVILEGDFILPALAAQSRFRSTPNDGGVLAAFLFEPDEAQIIESYRLREPEAGPQTKRAHVSWLHGLALKREAERCGLPVVTARPWNTVVERLAAALAATFGLRTD